MIKKKQNELVFLKVVIELLSENCFELLDSFLENKAVQSLKSKIYAKSILTLCSNIEIENFNKTKNALNYLFNKKELDREELDFEIISKSLNDFLISSINSGMRLSVKKVQDKEMATFSKWKELVCFFESNVPGFVKNVWVQKDLGLDENYNYDSEVLDFFAKSSMNVLNERKQNLLEHLYEKALTVEMSRSRLEMLNLATEFLVKEGATICFDKKKGMLRNSAFINYLAAVSFAAPEHLSKDLLIFKNSFELMFSEMKAQKIKEIPVKFKSEFLRYNKKPIYNKRASASGLTKEQFAQKLKDELPANIKSNILDETNKFLFYKKVNYEGLVAHLFFNLNNSLYDDMELAEQIDKSKLTMEVFKYLCQQKDLRLTGSLATSDLNFFSDYTDSLNEATESEKKTKNYKKSYDFLKEICVTLAQSDVEIKSLKKIIPPEIYSYCEKERLNKSIDSKNIESSTDWAATKSHSVVVKKSKTIRL